MVKIKVYQREVYGRVLYYISNRFIACDYYDLTGKKTLSLYDMELIRKMFNVDFDIYLCPQQ